MVKMTKNDWLMKFRRCQLLDTLEIVYEHLLQETSHKDVYVITQAYDHRKAELAVGKFFDRVPAHVWKFVK